MRYRALVLIGTFGSLRWGELAALQRGDVNVKALTVRVERQLTETVGDGAEFGPPKSDAGRRVVPIPGVIGADLVMHVVGYAQDGDEGLIFTSSAGTQLRHSNLYRRAWLPAVKKAAHARLRRAARGIRAGTHLARNGTQREQES